MVIYYALFPVIKLIEGISWVLQKLGLAAEEALHERPEEGLKQIGAQLEELRRQFEAGWSGTTTRLADQAREELGQIVPPGAAAPAEGAAAALRQVTGIAGLPGTQEGQRQAQEALAKTTESTNQSGDAMEGFTEKLTASMAVLDEFTESMQRATDEGKQAAVVYND